MSNTHTLVGLVVRFWEVADGVLRPYAAMITESQAEDPRLGKDEVLLTIICPLTAGKATGVVPHHTTVNRSDTPREGFWTEIVR